VSPGGVERAGGYPDSATQRMITRFAGPPVAHPLR
jgi:hypothetical protein